MIRFDMIWHDTIHSDQHLGPGSRSGPWRPPVATRRARLSGAPRQKQPPENNESDEVR